MARQTASRTTGEEETGNAGRASRTARGGGANGARHEHRTAKIVELVSCSSKSFEDAIQRAIADASATTRGITGAHVENMSVSCADGRIVEYKVNVKVAFGVERT